MIEKFLIYCILAMSPFAVAFISASLVRYVEKKHDGTPIGFLILTSWIAFVIAFVLTASEYVQ